MKNGGIAALLVDTSRCRGRILRWVKYQTHRSYDHYQLPDNDHYYNIVVQCLAISAM